MASRNKYVVFSAVGGIMLAGILWGDAIRTFVIAKMMPKKNHADTLLALEFNNKCVEFLKRAREAIMYLPDHFEHYTESVEQLVPLLETVPVIEQKDFMNRSRQMRMLLGSMSLVCIKMSDLQSYERMLEKNQSRPIDIDPKFLDADARKKREDAETEIQSLKDQVASSQRSLDQSIRDARRLLEKLDNQPSVKQ